MSNASAAVERASDGKMTYEASDGLAIITLNDPERLNALSASLRGGLWEAFRQLDLDDSVRVGIITGVGESFSAGADLKELSDLKIAVPPRDWLPLIGHNTLVDKVLIAAVNGYALGGGFLLAQMTDLVAASENATFGMPETRWARGAPWSVPLAGKVPERIWMEIALTGDPITAQRAYEIGLVNSVHPKGEAMDGAMRLAERVLDSAALTVRATRRMIHLASEMGRSAAWEVADELFRSVYMSADAQEGPLSFKEKRSASFTGH